MTIYPKIKAMPELEKKAKLRHDLGRITKENASVDKIRKEIET